MKLRMNPWDVGWRIGEAHEPRGGNMWVPWDRTAGVIGPQGSGKTLDLLTPALLGAPGAALVTLTKVEDLLLSLTSRLAGDRPCVVLDPFGLADGLWGPTGGRGVRELVWDPIAGCVDPKVAERRAKAFTAGTVKGAINGGTGDDAARFYAAESAKVLQGYFHAAALTGKTLDDVLRWIANPAAATDPAEILRRHPHAEPFWHGLLHGALNGDDRTAGNTVTTVQQALSLFFQADTRRRCVPSHGRLATDLAEVIDRRGTIYLLGREDPYASASPLMTAVAEHVLDTALMLANRSPWGGRLCPPMLACLDELPSTAPLPTLRTRMANERALGLSFIYAAQTRAQLTSLFGEHESRALLGLTNVLVMFGGSKDVAFNQEISDLLGTVRVGRVTHNSGGRGGGRSYSGDDIAIMRPEEVRQLPERKALVIAENGKPIIAKLTRCVEGKEGADLLAQQRTLRQRLTGDRSPSLTPEARVAAALVEARRLGFSDNDDRSTVS
ncbi:TraM recognition domain-containing protein [Nocardioides sp. InS609-2]|uniref:type IV secretory system conjugative DNA transfer family protein n=1 Tax=Nocardioides sp. InS609-2 TaxID=2760705 RepID=UPI0020BF93F9|nr:TraM recognition domain-containing protein [Nocardioides sp. InS609-2]